MPPIVNPNSSGQMVAMSTGFDMNTVNTALQNQSIVMSSAAVASGNHGVVLDNQTYSVANQQLPSFPVDNTGVVVSEQVIPSDTQTITNLTIDSLGNVVGSQTFSISNSVVTSNPVYSFNDQIVALGNQPVGIDNQVVYSGGQSNVITSGLPETVTSIVAQASLAAEPPAYPATMQSTLPFVDTLMEKPQDTTSVGMQEVGVPVPQTNPETFINQELGATEQVGNELQPTVNNLLIATAVPMSYTEYPTSDTYSEVSANDPTAMAGMQYADGQFNGQGGEILEQTVDPNMVAGMVSQNPMGDTSLTSGEMNNLTNIISEAAGMNNGQVFSGQGYTGSEVVNQIPVDNNVVVDNATVSSGMTPVAMEMTCEDSLGVEGSGVAMPGPMDTT